VAKARDGKEKFLQRLCLGCKGRNAEPRLLQAFVQPRGIVRASVISRVSAGDGFHFPNLFMARKEIAIGNPALEGDPHDPFRAFNNSFTLPKQPGALDLMTKRPCRKNSSISDIQNGWR